MRGPSSRAPLTPFEWWFSALFLAIIVGAFVAVIVQDYEPVKLVPVFFVIFWLVLLPIHEAGHALVAHLLGWYVGQVVIGMGRTLHRFKIGKTSVELRMFPIEGFCGSVPTNLRWPRLKNALIYFAGPGVELLILGFVVLAVGPRTLLSRSDNVGILACQGLGLAVLSAAFFNLVPHYADTQSGMIPNDGLGILQSFTKPDRYFADLLGWRHDPDAERWTSDDDASDDEWEAHDPTDWWRRET
jgi:peptidase M50-like protein